MKRIILILTATFMVASVYGQNIRSKNGERVLPQAQDWSIGIDATPFFSYAKSLIGAGINNTSPTFDHLLSNQMITGKYFLQSDLAVRGALRIGARSNNIENMVANRTISGTPTFPNEPAMVANEWNQRGGAFGLSVGLEKRRGNTRLQGYYGGEIGFMTSNNRNEFTYGNALSNGTSAVTVTAADQFTGANNIVQDTYNNPARITENNLGRMSQFGLRAFIGAEYFIFPKISFGGEFGWGLGFQSTRGAERTTESYNAATDAVGIQTIKTGDSRGFVLDTDNTNSMFGPAGSLRINLYF